MAGALYLTALYGQGYTLQSLRRDLVDDPAVLGAVNVVYQAYLQRDIAPSDYENVKQYLVTGGSLRDIELMVVGSAKCQS